MNNVPKKLAKFLLTNPSNPLQAVNKGNQTQINVFRLVSTDVCSIFSRSVFLLFLNANSDSPRQTVYTASWQVGGAGQECGEHAANMMFEYVASNRM